MNKAGENGAPVVGLFATCLVDLLRPGVGFASAALLQQAGCRVEVPPSQTCCGQPAYNAGDNSDTKAIARQVIVAFEDFDYVVAPSGSCAGMIRCHYPTLFEEDPATGARARALADKTHELVSFLTDVVGFHGIDINHNCTVTYHDSCSGLRELDIKNQPRALLDKISGLSIIEGKEAETCCGFGGLFCVEYPDISERIVDEKINDIAATGADMLVAGDLGCLFNIAGRLKRRGSTVKSRHVAEVLAGVAKAPAIGCSDK